MSTPDSTEGKALVLVVMGVSGSGKTTVARILADRLGWVLEEGGALRSEANIAKMRAGSALTAADRQDWLPRVADWVDERLDDQQSGVITCSALKRSYRNLINRRGSGVVFVFLAGAKTTIARRLATRHGHFMPPTLLDSQLDALEEPGPDEPAIRIDLGGSPEVIAQRIVDEPRLC